ncbi:hypothetical protein CSB45_10445 [candidate division KSB3 bacterium]|uniref:Uncharacterized protein n=1 Tax=candidate division KSB3 bacterium TaxID=2044937 RepID=A0A2G6E3K1_9BACT|nr:MAG: hypothetical protein CSB45_10445 [candidate division KSB3 bacterium]PIE29167.1 MAG: hypothetical protein CSA57_10180 [candidate division KSB3 bacterium]
MSSGKEENPCGVPEQQVLSVIPSVFRGGSGINKFQMNSFSIKLTHSLRVFTLTQLPGEKSLISLQLFENSA